MTRLLFLLAFLLPLSACQTSPEAGAEPSPTDRAERTAVADTVDQDRAPSTPGASSPGAAAGPGGPPPEALRSLVEADTLPPIPAPDPLLDLNTTPEAEFAAVFGERMAHEFVEYRPYSSIREFRREIGKYVDEARVAEYETRVFVPIDPNASDAETLMQLPGIDAAGAATLIDGRPYETTFDFASAVAQLTAPTPTEVSPYLAR